MHLAVGLRRPCTCYFQESRLFQQGLYLIPEEETHSHHIGLLVDDLAAPNRPKANMRRADLAVLIDITYHTVLLQLLRWTPKFGQVAKRESRS